MVADEDDDADENHEHEPESEQDSKPLYLRPPSAPDVQQGVVNERRTAHEDERGDSSEK